MKVQVEKSKSDDEDEADKERESAFASADHWNHKWEKLKSWRTVQSAILNKLNSGEAAANDDVTVTHGFQLLKSMVHSETIRSFTYVKTMHGLVFITNSGTDLRSFMNIWNLQGFGAENISRKKLPIVTKCTLLKYIPKLKKLVAYSPDQKLKVLDDVTRGFEVINEVTTPSSLSCLEWNPDTEEVFCGGTHGVYIYKINEDFHLIQNKSYDIALSKLAWCGSLLLDTKNKMMMVICDQKIYVYSYEKGTCTHILQNRHTLALTCCTFYEPKDLLVTASKDGTIKIWNGLAFTLVTDIIAHSEAVTGLELHRVDSLLFSCSLDYTIKVWRLDTYEMFMRIDVGDRIRGMRVIGANELFVWTDRQIRTYRVNMIYGFYAPVYSTVHKLVRVCSGNHPTSIVCCSGDGVVRMFTTLSADTYTTIFPQKTFQVLTQVAYIKSMSKFMAVLDSGDVMVYDASTNPATPSHILEANVKYDEHIKSIALIKRDRAAGEEESTDGDTLVFAGHQNGEITLLYSSKSRLLDMCRAHLAPVDMLETSEGKIGSQHFDSEGPIGNSDRLISSSRDKKIKVWALLFEENEPNSFSLVCLKMIDSAKLGVPAKLCMLGSTLAAAWPAKQSISVLMMYSLKDAKAAAPSPIPSQRRVSITGTASTGIHNLSHSKNFDHTKDVNGLACHSYFDIFITTSRDGSLKVWDRDNNLLREVLFEESLSSCCFADSKGTILVGYKNHIHSVSLENYLPHDMLQKVILEEFGDEEEEMVIPYQLSIQEADIPTLAREPAVSNPRRNARLQRDTKSDEGCPSDASMDGRKAANSSAEWRKLGASNRMINILSSVRKASRAGAGEEPAAQEDSLPMHSSPKPKRRAMSHSRIPEGFQVKPVVPMTRVQFDMAVGKKQREKQDTILEENKRRMDVARQLEEEHKNRSKWYPIAPDGIIPNSVIRELLDDLCGSSDPKEQPKLAFTDIAMLISKLPGLSGAEKSVNEYLVNKIRSKKKSIAERKSQQAAASQQQLSQQQQKVQNLVPDDSQMLMKSMKWCNEYVHAAPLEVSHFYMRKDEIVDLNPKPEPPPPEAVNDIPSLSKVVQVVQTGATDKKRQGINLLKSMSREPWWNNTANLTVVDALHQIISLLPRAVSRLHMILLQYLIDIHSLFGIPDTLHLLLADSLIRNMQHQKESETAVLATLNCIGDMQFGNRKIIGELARMVQTDPRKAIVNKALELLKLFTDNKDDLIGKDMLEELAHVDDNLDISHSEVPEVINSLKVHKKSSSPAVKRPTTADWSTDSSDTAVGSDVSPSRSATLELRQSSGMLASEGEGSHSVRESIYSVASGKSKNKFNLSKAGGTWKKLDSDHSVRRSKSPSRRSPISEVDSKGLTFTDSTAEGLVKSLDGDEEADDEDDGSDGQIDFIEVRTKREREPRAKRSPRHTTRILEGDEEEEPDGAVIKTYARGTKSDSHSAANMSSARSRDSGLASTKTRMSGVVLGLDESADYDAVTPSVNDRLTLSLDEANLTDTSDSLPVGFDLNKLVPLGSTNDEENWREMTKTLHTKSMKSLKQLSDSKSEQWLNDNMLPPIQAIPGSRDIPGHRRGKITYEKETIMKHVQSLESTPHDHRNVHGSSEVAVSDLIRSLWTEVDESDVEWKRKFKSDIGQHRFPSMAGERTSGVSQYSRVQSGHQFRWDAPLPPAPGSKLNLSNWKDLHSRYCEYWRMVRKGMHKYSSISQHQDRIRTAHFLCDSKRDFKRRVFPKSAR